MSTPETPESPQLTRRQLRELRNTASNPIITPEEAEAAAAAPAVSAPLPRAAEPVVVAEEPPAAEDVDLDARALTRRAARQQERLRTASVPVVDGEAAADEAVAEDTVAEDAVAETDDTTDAEAQAAPADQVADEAPDGADSEPQDDAPSEESVDDAAHDETVDSDVTTDDADTSDLADTDSADPVEALADAQSEAPDVETFLTGGDDDEEHRPVVAPTFGSGLLAGDGVEIELPASFDQLLARGSAATGSLAASNALILSQTPDTGSFSAPVAATGEVLITGTFNLPESFGSTGTSHGSSDGKEIDAVLVDGELPASSSPTPIAASSAISTIKSADDIIKPPAPEKGGKLMLALVITAGALALALTGALIIALLTGVF